MSSLPMEVVEVVGRTMVKVIPVTIALALVFTVLSHFWACNPGKPRWRKRELITDICYWFFVPVFARIFRIGLLVLGAAVLFNIHEPDELIAFHDNGHGPLSQLPLWVQAILFLVASEFMLYWLHRWGRSNTLLATPVLHRWHHTSLEEGGNTNFAGTFPLLDVLFGTFRRPENRLPEVYGVDDQEMPTEIGGQLAYPFRQ
jgi:sterol desaturase/sphingolipid hydroxylase (fatty acid hydroxylase superfamily)